MADESGKAVARVLVVDDTEASRYSVARHLRHAGYTVDEADSGLRAIALVEESRPDLVVLDVMLPDISGFEVARRLRGDDRFSRIPILHLSASFTDPESLAAGLDSGADGYLTHPVEPVVLLASIRSLIRARTAEAEAIAAGEAWRATFHAITDGVCVVDDQARVTRWNDAFATFVGADGIAGRAIADLVPGLHANPEPPFLMGPDGLPPQATELAIDGRWVRVTAQAMSEAEGPPRHTVCVLTDVTKQRSAELRVQQVQRLEVAGQLAGGIAHEINNMMTVILGLTEFLARDDELPATHQRDLAGVRKAADRAADMARQLLAFSRRQVLQPRLVEVNTAIAGMSRLLRQLMGADREVTLTLSPEAGFVFADDAQLEQAILNLALNARDAMPAGGHFTISTTLARLDAKFAARYPDIDVRSGDYAHIALVDDGEGMTSETLDKVFEPFFTTKPVGQGTGLGLATVYGIVKQSGGTISVYSEPGRGSSFKVYLPQVEAEAGDTEVAAAALAAEGSGTVLLVEDEAVVRQLAARVLRASGYRLLVATDAADALRASGEHEGPIHLLLTDVIMPGTTGARLAAELVSSRPELRVLYMSGFTENAIAHHGVLDAETRFLQKPFTPAALALKVREVLGDVAGRAG
jgi:PAS domain S-box-containing protein